MNALVTGGAGFIGSHLVDRLLLCGWDVTAYDNLSEGRYSNVREHRDNNNFRFIQADVRNSSLLDSFIYKSDVIFHLAAEANIRKSLVDREMDLRTNLLPTISILDSMKRYSIRDIIFTSTGAVYGEIERQPILESFSGNPLNLYAASKLSCEAFISAYTEFSDIRSWIFRLGQPVGPRCRRGVIWDFVSKLKRNPNELEILGDGNQERDFMHVSDCVEGILTAYKKAKGKFNLFNLNTEDNTTINRVADIVIETMRLRGVDRKYTGGKKGFVGDVPIAHFSMERIKSLGWSPKVSSRDAIIDNVSWALKND
jgi:UDP-glucose 4-epimerase